jgi:hypothetical protein
MNRKQKVLTIIALIAFVVIGACHYLDCGFYQPEPVYPWREYTHQQSSHRISGAEFVKRLLDQGGYTDSKGQYQLYTKDAAELGFIPDEAKLWFQITEEPRGYIRVWKPYFRMVDPTSAMIPDVRMPWFMLGVIYVGLFFLLADKKEKQ